MTSSRAADRTSNAARGGKAWSRVRWQIIEASLGPTLERRKAVAGGSHALMAFGRSRTERPPGSPRRPPCEKACDRVGMIMQRR